MLLTVSLRTAARERVLRPRKCPVALSITIQHGTSRRDLLVICRVTNAWTIRLLRRKREFVKARIATMDELAANVLSCSLDRRCTFMLKTSADLEEMKRVVSSTLEETLSDGFAAQQTAQRAFPDPKKLQVSSAPQQASVEQLLAVSHHSSSEISIICSRYSHMKCTIISTPLPSHP